MATFIVAIYFSNYAEIVKNHDACICQANFYKRDPKFLLDCENNDHLKRHRIDFLAAVNGWTRASMAGALNRGLKRVFMVF